MQESRTAGSASGDFCQGVLEVFQALSGFFLGRAETETEVAVVYLEAAAGDDKGLVFFASNVIIHLLSV